MKKRVTYKDEPEVCEMDDIIGNIECLGKRNTRRDIAIVIPDSTNRNCIEHQTTYGQLCQQNNRPKSSPRYIYIINNKGEKCEHPVQECCLKPCGSRGSIKKCSNDHHQRSSSKRSRNSSYRTAPQSDDNMYNERNQKQRSSSMPTRQTKYSTVSQSDIDESVYDDNSNQKRRNTSVETRNPIYSMKSQPDNNQNLGSNCMPRNSSDFTEDPRNNKAIVPNYEDGYDPYQQFRKSAITFRNNRYDEAPPPDNNKNFIEDDLAENRRSSATISRNSRNSSQYQSNNDENITEDDLTENRRSSATISRNSRNISQYQSNNDENITEDENDLAENRKSSATISRNSRNISQYPSNNDENITEDENNVVGSCRKSITISRNTRNSSQYSTNNDENENPRQSVPLCRTSMRKNSTMTDLLDNGENPRNTIEQSRLASIVQARNSSYSTPCDYDQNNTDIEDNTIEIPRKSIMKSGNPSEVEEKTIRRSTLSDQSKRTSNSSNYDNRFVPTDVTSRYEEADDSKKVQNKHTFFSKDHNTNTQLKLLKLTRQSNDKMFEETLYMKDIKSDTSLESIIMNVNIEALQHKKMELNNLDNRRKPITLPNTDKQVYYVGANYNPKIKKTLPTEQISADNDRAQNQAPAAVNKKEVKNKRTIYCEVCEREIESKKDSNREGSSPTGRNLRQNNRNQKQAPVVQRGGKIKRSGMISPASSDEETEWPNSNNKNNLNRTKAKYGNEKGADTANEDERQSNLDQSASRCSSLNRHSRKVDSSPLDCLLLGNSMKKNSILKNNNHQNDVPDNSKRHPPQKPDSESTNNEDQDLSDSPSQTSIVKPVRHNNNKYSDESDELRNPPSRKGKIKQSRDKQSANNNYSDESDQSPNPPSHKAKIKENQDKKHVKYDRTVKSEHDSPSNHSLKNATCNQVITENEDGDIIIRKCTVDENGKCYENNIYILLPGSKLKDKIGNLKQGASLQECDQCVLYSNVEYMEDSSNVDKKVGGKPYKVETFNHVLQATSTDVKLSEIQKYLQDPKNFGIATFGTPKDVKPPVSMADRPPKMKELLKCSDLGDGNEVKEKPKTPTPKLEAEQLEIKVKSVLTNSGGVNRNPVSTNFIHEVKIPDDLWRSPIHPISKIPTKAPPVRIQTPVFSSTSSSDEFLCKPALMIGKRTEKKINKSVSHELQGQQQTILNEIPTKIPVSIQNRSQARIRALSQPRRTVKPIVLPKHDSYSSPTLLSGMNTPPSDRILSLSRPKPNMKRV